MQRCVLPISNTGRMPQLVPTQWPWDLPAHIITADSFSSTCFSTSSLNIPHRWIFHHGLRSTGSSTSKWRGVARLPSLLSGDLSVYDSFKIQSQRCQCHPDLFRPPLFHFSYACLGSLTHLLCQLDQPPVSELGFDPLYGLPPLEDFSKGLKARQGSVKGALLDQKFSAGVGNWVADEVLYQARVHPEVSPVSMSPEQIKSVYEALAYVVSTACKLSADSSKFPDNWLFHHRWGKKEGKVQGNAVKFMTVASRTTAWVPAVQVLYFH